MTIPYPVVALSLALVLAVLVVGIWQLASGTWQRRTMAARSALDVAERRAESLLGRLDSRMRRTTMGRAIARRILASGVRIRVSTFLVLLAGAAVAAIVVIGQVLTPLLGVVAALAVGGLFFAYLRRQEDRRREEFVNQLPELARVLSNAASAGLVIRTSLEIAAEELDEPARSELARTAEAMRVGQSLDEALRELAARLPSRELAVLVSTMLVAARSGGSLITSLRNIATTLEQRKETRREVKTILGRSVLTGYVVVFMGVAALFMMNALQPGVIDQMAGAPVGRILLIAACGLFALGLLLIRRATRIDV